MHISDFTRWTSMFKQTKISPCFLSLSLRQSLASSGIQSAILAHKDVTRCRIGFHEKVESCSTPYSGRAHSPSSLHSILPHSVLSPATLPESLWQPCKAGLIFGPLGLGNRTVAFFPSSKNGTNILYAAFAPFGGQCKGLVPTFQDF